ncbi:hypothetical protein TELCIR_07900, partial [Teladorsagia circumcincta]
MARSRSRSPRRDRIDDRKKKDKKRRRRDGSSDTSESHKLGSILRERSRRSRSISRERERDRERERSERDRDRDREKDRDKRRPVLSSEVERELTGSFDISNISTEAREWLEERIAEQ